MSNIERKTIVYLESDDLKQLVFDAVAAAMERYVSDTPIDSKSGERELLSASEVCSRLHVTPQTLNNWHQRGYLTKTRIGGRKIYYNRADVMELAARSKQ